ncbi:MAG: PAS domain-containing protein [Candidatus Schekmanbacteria bacterium]|nr:PAS domain-containing protein [Candidatus Schekmanbacteria bacterium]
MNETQQLTDYLIKLFGESSTRKEYTQAVVDLIRHITGLKYIGIRILNLDGDIPYDSYAGFSRKFWDSENWLSVKKDRCACIRVVSGNPDPADIPFMTPSGSFCLENSIGVFAELQSDVHSKFRGTCIQCGFGSIAVIPLRYQNNTLGAIHIADKDSRSMGEIVELIESVAPLIATTVHRFNIEERIQRDYELQTIVSSLLRHSLEDITLDEFIRLSAKTVFAVPWLALNSMGRIYLASEDSKKLILTAHNGLSEESQRSCVEIPFGRCLCGKAALGTEVFFAEDSDARHEYDCHSLPEHGHYCVPITYDRKALGVINLYTKQGHRRSSAEEEFLKTIADTLAGIIARKGAEENQKQLEKQKQELIEALDAIVWEAQTNPFQFTFVSRKAEKILGYPVRDWLSEMGFWRNHVHPEDREKIEYFISETVKHDGSYQFAYKMIASDGSVLWFRNNVAIESSEGKPPRLRGMMVDITKVKKMEEEKEKTQAQLFQTQKLESIVTMTGGIAHDFANVLSVIKGYSDIAIKKADRENPLRGDLEEIKFVTEKGIALIRQLLFFSNKQQPLLKEIDINASVNDAMRLLSRSIGDNISVDIDLASDLKTVQADKVHIEQMLMNLALNARDAMPSGGKLAIRTENVTVDKNYCRSFPDANEGDYICLSVSDTGVGMDDELKKRIFEPFFTTKNPGKGTGLGLSVVYGIAKKHGGWIELQSTSGEGTVFKIFLPVC